MSEMSAIANAVQSIANLASMRMNYAGETREAALIGAAQGFIANAEDARARRNAYRFETSSETVEDVLFHASVAHDIIDGEVSRPSVGNVRAYALSLI